jgi:hypothetical protein
MTLSNRDARILVAGIIPIGFDADKVSPEAKQQIADALKKILALVRANNRGNAKHP